MPLLRVTITTIIEIDDMATEEQIENSMEEITIDVPANMEIRDEDYTFEFVDSDSL